MPPQEAPQMPAPQRGNSLWKVVTVLLGLVVVVAGVHWYVTQDKVATTPGTPVYENTEYNYRFEYPSSVTVQPATSRKVQMIESEETVPLPAGSVEIPGVVIISPIPYSEISAEKPIYNYFNCCTGMTYSFNSAKNEWQANDITHDNDSNPPTKLVPASLTSSGVCSLEQTFGSRTYYKIESGDEGVPTDVYYFLPTNKGYALRFLTAHDLQGDYSTYPEEIKPDPQVLKIISDILASVTLTNDTAELKAACR